MTSQRMFYKIFKGIRDGEKKKKQGQENQNVYEKFQFTMRAKVCIKII